MHRLLIPFLGALILALSSAVGPAAAADLSSAPLADQVRAVHLGAQAFIENVAKNPTGLAPKQVKSLKLRARAWERAAVKALEKGEPVNIAWGGPSRAMSAYTLSMETAKGSRFLSSSTDPLSPAYPGYAETGKRFGKAAPGLQRAQMTIFGKQGTNTYQRRVREERGGSTYASFGIQRVKPKNGRSYLRRGPEFSQQALDDAGLVWVKGHRRSNGQYVRAHLRAKPVRK